VCSLSLISPDAEKFLTQARKLRDEVKVLEKELLEERIASNPSDIPQHIKYRESLIPKIFSTKIQTVPKNTLVMNWELEKNGETHLDLIDHKNKVHFRAIGKWRRTKSRFGIGSNVILKARGIGFTINSKFVSLSKSDYILAKNTYNRCLLNLKNMNKDLEAAKKFSNTVLNIREPEPLFPIITQESLAAIFMRSLRRWSLRIHSFVLNKMFYITINRTKNNTEKWKQIVNIGKSENYIKFDNEFCVIQNTGILSVKGVLPYHNRWIRSPKASFSCICNLEIINLIKSRTGGRAGGIKS
tara:strand:+ start:365 stop:1261 length:897 start_codon:yes stop_codon:yes gene_type:complete